ncbi:MAG: condensation domain-containing protein, partial [Salinibacter sp.]
LRFVPDPHSDEPGRRVYRTGDRARWTSEERLEYLGRTDTQLQIRGIRIETGEVEATLAEAEGIDLAAVRPLNERSGKADGLVAYVVPTDDAETEPVALKEWSEAHLPGPAVPRSIQVLDEMPLRPSGKIDRSALPAPDTVTERREDRTPPQTETQRQVASIWKHHLDLEEVGIHENFFRVGGHSLLAVRVQHDIADQLGAEVPLETFLDAPTIADLADALEVRAETSHTPIERHDYDDEVPLSASQRRMWLLQTLNPDSVAYNVPALIRLNRHVDLDVFHRALTRLVERHEVLRTTFPERDGSPVQKIHPPPDPIPWTVEDVTAAQDPEAEAQTLIDRRIQTPFDLTDETPLRLSLIKVADEEWLFCPLFHHIAIDEWTFGVLLDDLEALYEAERTRGPDTEVGRPEGSRADAWQDAHEVLHQDLSPDTVDDPTLNTTGWVSSYDGEPFSEAEMRDWLRGRIAPLRRLDLGRTLEIGAGTGMLLFRLAPDADEYVGLDFSKPALEYVDTVASSLDADYSNVSLVHGRADEVGGLDGPF